MQKAVTRIKQDKMGQWGSVTEMVDLTPEEEAFRLLEREAARAEEQARSEAEEAGRAVLVAVREKAAANPVTDGDIMNATTIAALRAIILRQQATIERLTAEIEALRK